MTNTVTDFLLKAPCEHCPFRKDIEPYLRPERAQEIATGLAEGAEFSCHKTTVPDAEDEGLVQGPGNRFCAGAMATLEREGHPNQLMRMAERMGFYDAAAMRDPSQPVYGSLAEWVRVHRDAEGVPTVVVDGEVFELSHCDVVADDCELPAGYMVGGSAVGNAEEPYLHPFEDACSGCGKPACESCRSSQWDDTGKYCVYCNEEDLEEL